MGEASAPRRVLVVDDEFDFVETLQDILTGRGCEVAVAHTPAEALRQAAAAPPQVALLDIRLGRASGIDLLSSLREAVPGLVFVMMTAYADLETAVQALTEGAHHYLRKPIDGRDLLATLDRCFERVDLQAQKAAAESALRERNAELAEVNARLQKMVRSAQCLASCTRLEDLSRQLLEEAARVMAAEGGSLFFRRDDCFERIWTLDGDHVPRRVPLPLAADSVFARVLDAKGPVVVRDIVSSPGLKGSGWSGYRDASLLVLPILRDDRVEALLSLHNKTWPPFTEQDRELAQVMISLSGEILKAQQATQAVRASEERYRLLAENVRDVIFTLDAGLRLSYLSPSYARLTGIPLADALEHGFESVVNPESLATARPVLQEMLARGGDAGNEVRTLDIELRRGEGGAAQVEVTLSRIDGPQGPSLLCVARDVTDRRREQAEIARLARVVEQTGDGVMITDLAGVIQYVNPAFERLTGYSRQEAVGETPRLLRSGAHDQAFYRGLWSTISGGGTWRGRITNRAKDGRQILEEGTISPFRDAAGRIVGYAAVKHDVTAQSALEARLAQAQRLESIGRLAGGIAHDFNNILVAITGFAELLQRAPLGDKQQRYVRGISEAAWRAADLTRQILTFSRQGSLEHKPLEMGPVVSEALQLMRAALPASVEIKEALRTDTLVNANATQLHQVMLNLCTNAGFALRGDGGLLEVILEDVDVQQSWLEVCPPLVPGRHVCLSLRDTGCGMSPEVLARIFEPFFTTRAQGEGTGMGLAVVHGIVQDHGGAITVQSAPGAGTTFRVYLPAVGTAPASGSRGLLPEGSRGERVLFVDDEPVQVELAREMLGSLGYRVVGVGNGQEALALLSRDPAAFDAVVTDATMPGLSGAELAIEIARLRPGLPVLLCTGFGDRVEELRARTAVREIVVKPYSLADLSRALRRTLGSPAKPPA